MPHPVAVSKHTQLPRSPLVSDEIAKNHNVYFAIDTRFRRAARLLQALWLKDKSIETGIHVRGKGSDSVVMPLASNLSAAAATAGKNFLTQNIRAFVARQLIMRETGALFEERRLFANALSSAPLCANLVGELSCDLDLATRTFKKLFPSFVERITSIDLEHSPLRRDENILNDQRGLADRTAFDIVIRTVCPDGSNGSIYAEVKYSEDCTEPPATPRQKYELVSRSCGLFVDPDSPTLRSLSCQQYWREGMLAQLCVDEGFTDRAMFVVISPRLNRNVTRAVRIFESELIPEEDRAEKRIQFRALNLETVVEAIGAAGATEIANALWARYLDFGRIYDLCLDVSLPANVSSSEVKPSGKDARKQLVRSLKASSRASSRSA